MRERTHPYQNQPPQAFWRETVTGRSPSEIGDWYKPKFDLTGKRIAVAGSCFAQHVGRRLRESGFAYVDAEPFVNTGEAPPFLSPEAAIAFGFNMYSARFGNVYTARQLLQLLMRATGEYKPQTIAWPRGGGFVDCFRPTIEPEPLASEEQVRLAQQVHLRNVRTMFANTDVLVFTLGLTEAWVGVADGAVYPVAPGVAGGRYDPEHHRFENFDYDATLGDMEAFIARFRRYRPEGKLLLTVSPVPLVATATPDQVVVATSYSKAVLRAVAGFLAAKYDFVDYFPSYEIVSAPPMRGVFYADDLREVLPAGVDHVMQHFFAAHPPPRRIAVDRAADQAAAVACDEELIRREALQQ